MNKIFITLPFWLKTVAFWIVSIIEKKKRKGIYYLNYKSKFIRNAQENINEREFIQNKALEIVKKTPYYQEKKIDSFEDIPIISKKIINDNYESFCSSEKAYKIISTSGTSGEQLSIPVSKKMYQKKFASYDSFRELNNMQLNVPNANFFGREIFPIKRNKAPFWLYSPFSKQLVFSQYHLNQNTIKAYLNALELYNIKWIHGYPSFLNLFSELILEAELLKKTRNLNIKKISTGSESLLSFQKQNIENVFGCKVIDFYGQAESVAHIYTLKNNLYIDQSFSLIEFIHYRDNFYHIVGTQVDNENLPFIRYNTGDLVRLNEKNEILEIIGRIEDYIYLKDGRKISRLDHIFKTVMNLRESKIIQRKKGSAKILINPTDKFSEKDLKDLKDSIENKLGSDFDFTIVKTDYIPKTKMGKLKFVECSI